MTLNRVGFFFLMRNIAISYLWNANSIKITGEISTGITCSRVQFKSQCCKLVWVSWCHSKERFIHRIIMLELIYIKVTSSLLLLSHFFEGRTWVFSGSSSLGCTHSNSPPSFLWRIVFCESLKSLQASLFLHQWGMMVDNIFCYCQSLPFFSQSSRFTAVVSKRVCLILQICALHCLLQSPTEEIVTSIWCRVGSRTEISVWKVSLLWLKSVQTHWESRSHSYIGLFWHESSVVKGTELTYDSENLKMLQFK